MATSQFAPSVNSTSHKQRISDVKQTFGRLRRYCSRKLRAQPQLQPHSTTQPASLAPFLALPAEIPDLPCQTSSRLLDLPPELRNAIYEYVLVLEQPIIITKTSKWTQLGLLRVCKQIRHEAASLYYNANKFRIDCSDLDFTLYLGFENHTRQWDEELDNAVLFNLGGGQANWSSLMVLLKAVHEGQTAGLVYPDNVGGLCAAAVGASRMVLSLRRAPWADVETALEFYKRAVVDSRARRAWTSV
ncbi:hypothetical protein LTR56_025093 [Elasticomyces elasticus]|nr:hypothetical protein LTR56_025093 [Elasticomyces elasticus]KAK3663247.1 hypothetical protein LTR22_005905 [Elasticomyces elasticus]